jgi:CHASE3 domain sensor protein
MIRGPRKAFTVFARGTSLRRKVAYSLAIVRLILVPVILLAIYYLFAMGRIVDRIVSVDAPVATRADHASSAMLDARRAEQNYFLLHDPSYLEASRESLGRLEQIIASCDEIAPDDRPALRRMQAEIQLYRRRFDEAVAHLGTPGEAPVDRIKKVVRAYEKQLEDLLSRARRLSRTELMEELRTRAGSLDTQMSATIAGEDPALRQAARELRASSDEILRLAGELEKRSSERVKRDHQGGLLLLRRAEWVLISASALTLLVSVWVSFILPRAAVRPLVDLKAAVDHAAAGNYEIEFDLQGEAEVVQLAASVRNLIAHLREKKNNSSPSQGP